jgi:predicted metal-dependent hydrolase
MDAAERRQHLAAGQRQLNRGQFRDAHEHWEEAWKASAGPERRWIQGMIQIATGLHKLAAGRADLCRVLFVKALAKLADAPARFDGFDLARFRRDAADVLAAIERGESPAPSRVCLRECS